MDKTTVNTKKGTLSLGTKISYGAGDLASQFVWSFITSYLMLFYTDVALLSAAAISMIFLVARIWDAVNDPMMGALAERTRTKHGRFRPYLLYGTPLLVIFYVLCFMAPEFGGNMTMKVIYATVTYIGLGMLYTAVNLPYGALMTVMSTNSNDRADLSTFRMLGSNIGSLILSAVSLPLILYFGNGSQAEAKGYTMTAIILGDKTGIRADGTAYSVYSFGTKLSSALTGTVGVLLLAQVGYVANAVQTAEAMQGISMVVNILPGACWLIALLPLFLYNLSEDKCAEIRTRLDAKAQAD